MDAWATAADLARLYTVSAGTIQRWAREDGWRRTTTRPIRYRWDDAQDGYEKRLLAKRAGWSDLRFGTIDDNGTTASR